MLAPLRWIVHALHRVTAIARKEYVHILMDPGALFLVIGAPAVVLTLLAYVFTYDLGDSRLAVVDLDRSAASAGYLRLLTSDGDLDIVARPRSSDEAIRILERGGAEAALIIPRGFGADLAAGTLTPVQSIVDGVETPSARHVMAGLAARTRLFAAQSGAGGPAPIEVRARAWFNENLTSAHSMVPGLMALVLILPAMAAGLSVSREKETGTLETLISTPVLSSDILIGKLGVYLVLGTVGAVIALGVALAWFGVPFRGSLLAWLGATAAYLTACMAFSLLVAHFAPSQQTTMVLTLLALFMPGFLMSGLTDPVEAAWGPARLLAILLPTTHYIALSRGIALKGLSLAGMWPQLSALLLMAFLGVGVAMLLFRKKLA